MDTNDKHTGLLKILSVLFYVYFRLRYKANHQNTERKTKQGLYNEFHLLHLERHSSITA